MTVSKELGRDQNSGLGHAHPSAPATDAHLQADPGMQEGRVNASRLAIYGLVILVLVGAVFYGLSSQSPAPTGTAQSTSSAGNNPAASSSNIRDVTPNRDPGTTTGTAPIQAHGSPKSNPTGTEVDRAKGPAR